MRILHVLDHSLPLQSGYSYRTDAILNEQERCNWETIQVTSAKHTPADNDSVSQVGGRIFYRTSQPSVFWQALPVINQAAIIATLARRLDEVIQDTRPDIIHAHSPALTGIAALRACRQHKLPLVYELRALWEDGAVDLGKTSEGSFRYRASHWLETYVLRRANAVTTICEGLRQDIISRDIAAEKVTVIPNAVNLEEFSGTAPQSRRIAESLGLSGKTVIGFIGSFYRWEGLDFLLDALPEISSANSDAVVLLVGGGPEEARLRRRAAELQIDDQVIFTGRVPHADICTYYDLMDLMVYPRRSMRLTELVTPLKPLEAMARGRMLVASNVGGHRELIEDSVTGKLFAADDAEALAEAINSVLSERNDWPSMIIAAKKFVAENRTWQRSVSRYANIYRNLLNEL